MYHKLLVFRVCFGRPGAASSLIGLNDRVHDLCSDAIQQEKLRDSSFQRYSLKIVHVGLRVSLFVHAPLMMHVIEEAHHDGSAIVLVRGM